MQDVEKVCWEDDEFPGNLRTAIQVNSGSINISGDRVRVDLPGPPTPPQTVFLPSDSGTPIHLPGATNQLDAQRTIYAQLANGEMLQLRSGSTGWHDVDTLDGGVEPAFHQDVSTLTIGQPIHGAPGRYADQKIEHLWVTKDDSTSDRTFVLQNHRLAGGQHPGSWMSAASANRRPNQAPYRPSAAVNPSFETKLGYLPGVNGNATKVSYVGQHQPVIGQVNPDVVSLRLESGTTIALVPRGVRWLVIDPNGDNFMGMLDPSRTPEVGGRLQFPGRDGRVADLGVIAEASGAFGSTPYANLRKEHEGIWSRRAPEEAISLWADVADRIREVGHNSSLAASVSYLLEKTADLFKGVDALRSSTPDAPFTL